MAASINNELMIGLLFQESFLSMGPSVRVLIFFFFFALLRCSCISSVFNLLKILTTHHPSLAILYSEDLFKEFGKHFFFFFQFPLLLHSHFYFSLHFSPPFFFVNFREVSPTFLEEFLFRTYTYLRSKSTLFSKVPTGSWWGKVSEFQVLHLCLFYACFFPAPRLLHSRLCGSFSHRSSSRQVGSSATLFRRWRYRTEIGGDALNRPTAMRCKRRWR